MVPHAKESAAAMEIRVRLEEARQRALIARAEARVLLEREKELDKMITIIQKAKEKQ
jgi:hypothetical protein